jgi:hypothetical protein
MDNLTIPEQLMFTTFRIATEAGTGTGFVFAHTSQDGQSRDYLVTNRHVVEGTGECELTFTVSDQTGGTDRPLIGRTVTVPVQEQAWEWTYHSDQRVDLAAMRLGPVVHHVNQRGHHVYFTGISTRWLAGPEEFRLIDAMDEVIFVGYPSGIYDAVNNLPIIRTGSIATLPQTDYNGNPEFLIDASVFPGSSGSPVLIYNRPPWLRKDGQLMNRERLLFLGVVKQVHYRTDEPAVERAKEDATTRQFVTTTEMIDLGVVQKAAGVVETIERLIGVNGGGKGLLQK